MNTDKPLGAGLIALGVSGIAVTLQISVRTFNNDPGPKLFPMLGFGLLIFCGLGLLFFAKPPAGKPVDPARSREIVQRGAIMSGLMVAYAVGLWQVGYYIATPLCVYAFYHVIAGPEKRVPWKGALYALCVTGGVSLVFSQFLNTLLPQGALF